MNTLLRKLAEWKGRRRAAQVIVFDGGAEVERTRAFFKGAVAGAISTLVVFMLTAPTGTDAKVIEELRRREEMLQETNGRLRQAMAVTDLCLTTAERMEETLTSYHTALGTPGRR